MGGLSGEAPARRAVRPAALFLIGFPGSGKSTWRAAYLAGADRPTVVVSTDDMIEARARLEGLSYAQAWRRAASHKLDARARADLRAAVEQGLDVIVDRTNLRAAGRAKFLRLAPESYERRAVVFVTPFEVMRERLAARAAAGGHGVGWGIVVHMMKGYEAPRPGEFDAVEFVLA